MHYFGIEPEAGHRIDEFYNLYWPTARVDSVFYDSKVWGVIVTFYEWLRFNAGIHINESNSYTRSMHSLHYYDSMLVIEKRKMYRATCITTGNK